MIISLKGKGALYKNDLMMLEMIAQANWTRPLYVATTVGSENFMNLGDNFVQEGLVNRITPFTTNIGGKPVEGMTNFDTEKTYDNVMHRFKFGGASTPGIYFDETVMRMCYTHRRLMSQLALHLAQEGKDKQAVEVLDRCEKELPAENVPHDFQSGSLDIVRTYAATGQKAKALDVAKQLWQKSCQYMNYYCSLKPSRFAGAQNDCLLHLYILNHMLDILPGIDEKSADSYADEFNKIADTYAQRGGRF
jgi:hypothetical protein